MGIRSHRKHLAMQELTLLTLSLPASVCLVAANLRVQLVPSTFVVHPKTKTGRIAYTKTYRSLPLRRLCFFRYSVYTENV